MDEAFERLKWLDYICNIYAQGKAIYETFAATLIRVIWVRGV